MFQSSCDHLQGVFLKTCFLKEVDVSTVAGAGAPATVETSTE